MRGRIDPHARYRELIAARLDQPLTRVELRMLNGHLKKCAGCHELETEYRAERNLLRGLAAPIPPRDLWARTSTSLDREVALAYRAQKWRRRITRGNRSPQPSTALMTAIAAIGVTAALALLQLAPAVGPLASTGAARATPLSISPMQIAWLGQGPSDMAVYQTDVSQVCPTSGPLDCVPAGNFVRTPLQLPSDMRAGNVSLNPNGNQLAVVGHLVGEDVIAVVTLPQDKSANQQPKNTPDPANQIGQQGPQKTHDPGNGISDPTAIPGPGDTLQPPGQPSTPPASAVSGLEVLSILDNVQSAGSAPDWSPKGDMLAFSAMPDDESTGPDVYIWSPGDARAQAITSDHMSYFASWSGNRIVVSRITAGSARPLDLVIDPSTREERAVGGPQLWLPTVDDERVQAVGWYGQLDTSGLLPTPRSGALYLIDWRTVDPFGTAASAPDQSAQPDATDAPGQATPTATELPPAPTTTDDAGTTTDQTSPPDATDAPAATPAPTDATSPDTPGASPTATNNDNIVASVPSSLMALEPDRDPSAAPVVDWQARWSADGEVLGVWIADSAGSSWGRLAVLAADPATELVTGDIQLVPMTLARRGFTLGTNRVAWVGPSDNNVDGDLRIRTWGTAGDGSLRLQGPDTEEVTPAT